MKRNLYRNQEGFGIIIIIAAVVFVIIAIGVMAYFLLNSKKATDEASKSGTAQSGTSGAVITDEQVPLKICETGDPEQCNDPVSNATVDKIKVDNLP